LTSKSNFLVIKPSINSIKPSIKFNWVYKHMILDFSSLKLNFLCQQVSHQSKVYCQISNFVFFNILDQFLTIFWGAPVSSSHCYHFWISSEYIFLDFFCFFSFFMQGPKNGLQQMPPLYNTYGAKTLRSKFCKDKQIDLPKVWLI
jgi:hypothetical protein